MEHRTVRRVQVLRLPVADDPPPEPDDPAPPVADRERHPVPEPVVVRAALPPGDETGVFEHLHLLARASERGRQPFPAGRREPELEPRRELPRQPARLQVLDRPVPARVFPELKPEVPVRALEGGVDRVEVHRPAAPFRPRPARTGSLARDLHADPLGQLLHRVDEPEAVVLHQERDRGAARPAPEAVVELLLPAHAERRGAFLVEGTAGEEVAAALPEPHPGSMTSTMSTRARRSSMNVEGMRPDAPAKRKPPQPGKITDVLLSRHPGALATNIGDLSG